MKKIIIALFTVILLVHIAGCGSQNTVDSKSIRTFTVSANGTMITPYVNFAWERTYTENGWLAGDGISATYILPGIVDELPEIQMDASISFDVSENGKIQAFDIFNEEYKRIYHRITEKEFRELDNGVYYVSVLVNWTGKYIASENDYETSGEEYIFKMTFGTDTIK